MDTDSRGWCGLRVGGGGVYWRVEAECSWTEGAMEDICNNVNNKNTLK